MSEIILSKKKIQFSDASSNKGGLNFGSDAFYANALLSVEQGIVIQGNEVGASTTSFIGATDIGDVQEDQINLTGSVSGNILQIEPDPSGVTHNLVFPSSLGIPGQYLKNNGTGNLSFGEIVTGYGTNHSWNFGVTKQLWSSAYGDPFVVTPSISPVTPISRSSNLPQSFPAYYASLYNRDLMLLSNINWCSGVLSWDQGVSSDHWEMRVSVRFADSPNRSSSDSLSTISGSFFLFGNDTIQNVSSGQVIGVLPTGGLPSDSTGIAVVFRLDTALTPIIQILENGTVTKTIEGQIRMNYNLYFQIRIQRRGNILRIERPTVGNATSGNVPLGHLVHEHTLQPNAVFSGTRWGMGSFSSGSGYFARLGYVECRALEE